jgi:hypothetical protein
MDTTLEKLKKYFPTLPQNMITKIYHARRERLRLLMNHKIPEDIRWMIEAKVQLSGESSNSFFHTCLGQVKALLKETSCKTTESLSPMCQMDL